MYCFYMSLRYNVNCYNVFVCFLYICLCCFRLSIDFYCFVCGCCIFLWLFIDYCIFYLGFKDR